MNKRLGQFMTPSGLAQLIARELGPCDTAIDFAAGQGALLRAVQSLGRGPKSILGFDVDRAMVMAASAVLSGAKVRHGNGLIARLIPNNLGRISVVGNPPFLGGAADTSGWVRKAFEGVSGKLGMDRAEVQFLARALVTARSSGGCVVMVMPIGFADGDVYRRIRSCLMSEYRLLKCIEVEAGQFHDTEARTVILVIDTKDPPGGPTEIGEFLAGDIKPRRVLKEVLKPGARLDARYHKAMRLGPSSAPQLGEMSVTIDRGVFSRKDAETMMISAVHTSDLGRAKDRKLVAGPAHHSVSDQKFVTVRKGDILLPRTGSRVSWEPVMVQSGEAPITDHVFRIRAPPDLRDMVYRSFCHPSFRAWLAGASKGVCATVLTKRELLQMPLFAFDQPILCKSVTS